MDSGVKNAWEIKELDGGIIDLFLGTFAYFDRY
jgi:hypothetical protein